MDGSRIRTKKSSFSKIPGYVWTGSENSTIEARVKSNCAEIISASKFASVVRVSASLRFVSSIEAHLLTKDIRTFRGYKMLTGVKTILTKLRGSNN